MVDMVKKVHKKGAEFLNAAEKIEGAAVVQAVGQFKKQVAFGAVGGLVGAAIGQAVKGSAEKAESGSLADSFPNAKQAILAISNQRWILFEQSVMSGGPKGVLAEWPLDQIVRIDLEKGKLTSKVNIIFSDESIAQVEAVKGAKPEALAEVAAARR